MKGKLIYNISPDAKLLSNYGRLTLGQITISHIPPVNWDQGYSSQISISRHCHIRKRLNYGMSDMISARFTSAPECQVEEEYPTYRPDTSSWSSRPGVYIGGSSLHSRDCTHKSDALSIIQCPKMSPSQKDRCVQGTSVLRPCLMDETLWPKYARPTTVGQTYGHQYFDSEHGLVCSPGLFTQAINSQEITMGWLWHEGYVVDGITGVRDA